MGWLAEVAATVSCQGTPSYEGAGGQSWLVFRWVDLVMSKSHEKSVKLQVIALREYCSVADKCLHRSPDHRSFACLAAWYRICYTDIGLSVFGSVNINKAAQCQMLKTPRLITSRQCSNAMLQQLVKRP